MDIGESQSNITSSSEYENLDDRQHNIILPNENQSTVVPDSQSTCSDICNPATETQNLIHNFISNNFEPLSSILDWSDPNVVIHNNIAFCDCGEEKCKKFNNNFIHKIIINLSKCNSLEKAKRLYFWMQIKNFYLYPAAISYFNIQMYKTIISIDVNNDIDKLICLYYVLTLNKSVYISNISIILVNKILLNINSQQIIYNCIRYLYIVSNYDFSHEYINKNIIINLTNILYNSNIDIMIFSILKIFYNLVQTQVKEFDQNNQIITNYHFINIFKEILSHDNLTEKIIQKIKSTKFIYSNSLLLNIFNNFVNFVFIDKIKIIKDYLSEYNTNKSKDDSCSICLEDINCTPSKRKLDDEPISLSCSHSFHKKCIASWLLKNNSCPNCREIINIQYPVLIHPECNFFITVRPLIDIDPVII